MGINIWLPIIINALILGILVSGIVIGKRNGVVYELVKLGSVLLLSGLVVLLSPAVTNLVIKIGFIQTLLADGFVTMSLIKAVSIVLLFLIGFVLITIILKIVKRIIENRAAVRVQYAKPAKIVGLNPKETRRLRKEQKQLDKKQHKEKKNFTIKSRTTKSKIFGSIFGLITAIFIGFTVTMPIKPIFNEIADAQPEISEITKGYEYTPYGQLDKVTGVVDIILK